MTASSPENPTDPHFKALMDAAVDCILLINGRGTLEAVNAAVLRLFGYQREELLGQNISMLMPEPDRSQHDRYIANYLSSNKAKIIGIGREVLAQTKSGEILPIYLSVGDYKEGENAKFVGIIRDLREQKNRELQLAQAEQDIHQLNSRLAQVSRISVMGEMAANIAHEVNQPLTAIATYAQTCQRLLNSSEPNVDAALKPLGKIAEQSLRAAGIIEGIRTWVRQQDSKRQISGLPQLIEDVIDIAKLDKDHPIAKLQLELEQDLPAVEVDPTQIQQVIFNLIRNALDATASENPSEPVTVTARKVANDRVEISVSDRGAGLDDKISHQVFDPFFTTKDTGMGMGLSICKTIVEAHNGELSFTSLPEGGTRFQFILPTALSSTSEQQELKTDE